jgi:hypothetical protein
MTTLSHTSTIVQSWAEWTDASRWTILDEAPPEAADEPFHPSPEDLAYDTGYVVGSEDGVYRVPSCWNNDGRALRYAAGRQAGKRAREVKQAYDLGYAMGLETEQSEPPAGFSRHEARAYREGFSDAQREYEAYLDGRAEERMREAFGDPAELVHDNERRGVC